jgi:dTDP-4-dehydrorhamnose 3,5-epimerase
LVCATIVLSWVDIARYVFTLASHDPDRVTGVSTDGYLASAPGPVVPPRNSNLDLTKVAAIGHPAADAHDPLTG